MAFDFLDFGLSGDGLPMHPAGPIRWRPPRCDRFKMNVAFRFPQTREHAGVGVFVISHKF
jgi:hypothetical protein